MGPSPYSICLKHGGIQRDWPQIPVLIRDPNMGGTPKKGVQKWVLTPIVTLDPQTAYNVISAILPCPGPPKMGSQTPYFGPHFGAHIGGIHWTPRRPTT